MKAPQPGVLVCNRLADMTVMHPDQKESVCHKCGHVVGVYPTGIRALYKYPKMKLLCSRCANFDITEEDVIFAAGTPKEITKERDESKPMGRA